MRPKSIVLLMLALGCGLIASIGINQVLANRATQQAPVQDTTPIYVVQTQVELGVPVTAEMLKLEPWPTDLVPAGAIKNLGDVEGRVTKTRIYPGEPILANKLFSKGDSTAGPTVLIPDGHRVTPVKVDVVSGGSGLLQPGDRVDVLVFLDKNESKGIAISSAMTLLQDIRVFAVNAQFRRENEENDGMSMAKTVSLLLTPDQAEMVTLAANMGELQLVLRSPEDNKIVKDLTGRTANDILDMAGAGNRDSEKLVDESRDGEDGDLLSLINKQPETKAQPVALAQAPAVVEPPADKEPDWTMTLLQDGVASRVTFVDGFVHVVPLEQGVGSQPASSATRSTSQVGTSAASTTPYGGASTGNNSDEGDDFDFDEFHFDDDDIDNEGIDAEGIDNEGIDAEGIEPSLGRRPGDQRG
ncbi:MAG: Flp pilus assembly protein CpaB [Pirellulales bacterium]|nr:Flp pilus assembly protein CpaB [Planctomycetales bacterium]